MNYVVVPFVVAFLWHGDTIGRALKSELRPGDTESFFTSAFIAAFVSIMLATMS